MRTFLAALMIWALLFSGICCRSAKVQSPQTRDMKQTTVAPVTLTNDRTTGSFSVTSETTANAPPVLELSVTRVVNPAQTPLVIFVYLSPVGKKGQPEPEKFLVGNFSLYPPDRPGRFLLRSSGAFQELGAKGSVPKSNELQLIIEMRKVRDTEPWTKIEVTIDPPNWLRDEPK